MELMSSRPYIIYYNYYVIGDVIQVVPAMVVTYEIVEGASIHGGAKLFTSDGFSYTHRRTNRKNETLQFTRCACVRTCVRACVCVCMNASLQYLTLKAHRFFILHVFSDTDSEKNGRQHYGYTKYHCQFYIQCGRSC